MVGHPGTGVKEQTSGTYARLMAERGFVTLAFDAAYQGESGGLPRGLEDPAQRVEDFKAAVSCLTTRDEADPERIGLLGICASGSCSLAATGGDHRVRAVATVSTADPSRQFRLGADGAQDPAVFQSLLDAAAQARTSAARGEDPGVMTVFPETAEQAEALGGQHGREGFEYYCTTRGEHERSAKYLAWESIDKLAGYDAFFAVPLIAPRPVLQVSGSTPSRPGWPSRPTSGPPAPRSSTGSRAPANLRQASPRRGAVLALRCYGRELARPRRPPTSASRR